MTKGQVGRVGQVGQAGRVGQVGWRWIVAAVLLVGAARFAYALTASAQGWSGITYMELVYGAGDRASRASSPHEGAGRRWGPLFFLLMGAAKRVAPSTESLRVGLRLFLTFLYGATVVLLIRLVPEAPASRRALRRAALVFLCCQSTAAIYAIANGMGEIVTAFCVVAHTYCFVRRRYALAAFLICFSIYFKLFPIVFLFPYFAFSLLSREHRSYSLYLVASGLVLAAIAVPVLGWTYGFFYPPAMVRDVVSDPRVIPMRSKEVFGLLFFVDRMRSSFAVSAAPASPAATKMLTRVFSVLLIVSTGGAAFMLAKLEHVWNVSVERRRAALIAFQAAIGFAIVSFSLDVSLAHLAPIMVTLYAPLLLVVDSGAAVALFVAGTLLVGNLIPLSIVLRLLPLAWLDRLAGNAPAALIPLEKYLWYQIPLAGVYLIGLSLAYARWTQRPTTND